MDGFDKWLSKELDPSIDWAEHGLSRITRRWTINAEATTAAVINTQCMLPVETPDEEYSTALLMEQGVVDGTAFGEAQIYQRVYQELPANVATLVQLGNDVITYTESGLKQVEQRFVARRGHVLVGAIGETDTEDTAGEIFNPLQAEDGSVLLTESGVAILLNDAPELKQAPPAYNANIDGLHLAANGFSERGKVSAIVVKRWSEAGVLSVSQTYTKASSEVTVSAIGMTATQVGSTLGEVTDNHKQISSQASNYKGLHTTNYTFELDLYDIIDTELNGLRRVFRSKLLVAGALYEKVVGTDTIVHSINPDEIEPVEITMYLGSHKINDTTTYRQVEEVWMEPGILKVFNNNLAEGVREVTTTFLIVEGATVGPVTDRDTDNIEGLPTIIVTNMQSSDGGSIVETFGFAKLANEYERLVAFTYPGVVSIRQDIIVTESYGTVDPNIINFALKTPVQARVEGTISVFFQKSKYITDEDYSYDGAEMLWNPKTWASTYESGIGHSFKAFSDPKALRGYRTDNDVSGIQKLTPPGESSFVSNGVSVFKKAGTSYLNTTSGEGYARVDGVADSNGRLFTVNGKRIYGGTPFVIEVKGGPPDPVENKYVLDVDIRPAFEDMDGYQYYKKTIVHATIPDQGVEYGVFEDLSLTPPSGVSELIVGNDIEWTWTNNATGEFMNTRIERFDLDAGEYQIISNVFQPIEAYTDIGGAAVLGPQNYRFRTEEPTAGKASPWVVVQVVIAPTVESLDPVTVFAAVANAGDLDFTWTDPNESGPITIAIQKFESEWLPLSHVAFGTESYTEVNGAQFEGTYSYRVRAENSDTGINSEWAILQVVVSLDTLTPISGITDVDNGNDIDWSWTNNSVITGAITMIEKGDGTEYGWLPLTDIAQPASTYTEVGAQVEFGSFVYRFRTFDPATSEHSPWTNFANTVVAPLTAPDTLTLIMSGEDMDLSWNNALPIITGAKTVIEYRSPTDSTYSSLTEVTEDGANPDTYTHVDFVADGLHRYRLRTEDPAVSGDISEWVYGTFNFVQSVVAAPTRVYGLVVGDDIEWTWFLEQDANLVMQIEKDTGSGYQYIQEVTYTALAHTEIDGYLNAGVGYRFRIVDVATGNHSAYRLEDAPIPLLAIAAITDFEPTYSGEFNESLLWEWAHPLLVSEPTRYVSQIQRYVPSLASALSARFGTWTTLSNVDNGKDFYFEDEGRDNANNVEYRIRIVDTLDPTHVSDWTLFTTYNKLNTGITPSYQYNFTKGYQLRLSWAVPSGNAVSGLVTYTQKEENGVWSRLVIWNDNNPQPNYRISLASAKDTYNEGTYPLRTRTQNGANKSPWTAVNVVCEGA